MSGGGGGAPARVRIKGRKASVVRFFFLAVSVRGRARSGV
jgi:hypothetical protein